MIPKVSEWKQQTFIISEFHWGKNPGSVYLVVLVQVSSWGCTPGTGQSCSHFKVGLGMNSLTGSLLWLLTGFRSSLLTGDISSSPSKAPLQCSCMVWLSQSEGSDLRECKKGATVFLWPNFRGDIPSLSPYYICHRWVTLGLVHTWGEELHMDQNTRRWGPAGAI